MGDVVRMRSVVEQPEPLWREVLGGRIRERRRERRSTLIETATRAGISPQYLSEVERGLKDPSSEVVAAIAGALGTTLLELTARTVVALKAMPTSLQRMHGPLALAA